MPPRCDATLGQVHKAFKIDAWRAFGSTTGDKPGDGFLLGRRVGGEVVLAVITEPNLSSSGGREITTRRLQRVISPECHRWPVAPAAASLLPLLSDRTCLLSSSL